MRRYILKHRHDRIGVICTVGVPQKRLNGRNTACSLTVTGATSSSHQITSFSARAQVRNGKKCAILYCRCSLPAHCRRKESRWDTKDAAFRYSPAEIAAGFRCFLCTYREIATVPPMGSPSKHQAKLSSSLQQMDGITVSPIPLPISSQYVLAPVVVDLNGRRIIGKHAEIR